MVSDNWDNVIQIYRDIFLDSKYSYHANAMIELIPCIRFLPEFDKILPDTSHGALFFSVEGTDKIVTVLYSESGIYTIRLEHPSEGEIKTTTATSDDIVSVLQTFIKQLKSMKGHV